MILRDDHVAAWDAAADDTLERRIYYVQNWRSDVCASDAARARAPRGLGEGRVRAWHEPYGQQRGHMRVTWRAS
ncbi:MAG: hypothetical protein H6811_11370 [Phycisphaeraceae bacterium]|nr:hypothetical protein [Phycisphaeraceae bacterium]